MDRREVEDLYKKYGAMVLRRARAILRDEQAALDALQEVFIRALRAGGDFRGDASPVTWLYRVTTNYCLNKLRDAAKRRELMSLHPDTDPPADGTTRSPAETRLTLDAVLMLVPEELREIAVYYHVDGMSQAEISELTGVSRRTVGNRLEEFHRRAGAAAGALPTSPRRGSNS